MERRDRSITYQEHGRIGKGETPSHSALRDLLARAIYTSFGRQEASADVDRVTKQEQGENDRRDHFPIAGLQSQRDETNFER